MNWPFPAPSVTTTEGTAAEVDVAVAEAVYDADSYNDEETAAAVESDEILPMEVAEVAAALASKLLVVLAETREGDCVDELN